MKLRINIDFTDKYTGAAYKIGDEVTFEKARGEELLADKRELVTLIEEATPKKKVTKK